MFTIALLHNQNSVSYTFFTIINYKKVNLDKFTKIMGRYYYLLLLAYFVLLPSE